MYQWKVEPLCKAQLLDVDSQDILNNGLFRKCNVYKSGGGYDKFPAICEKRLGKLCSNQFVVQLQGCNLNCPYCYVTPAGINSKPTNLSSESLIYFFKESRQDIFHLMGGSPALYIEHWQNLINLMPNGKVFHSDLTLVEKVYSVEALKSIRHSICLYAVNIKGVSKEDFYANTRTKFNERLFWNNFDKVVDSGINFYITFTNPDILKLPSFVRKLIDRYGRNVVNDSFIIDLINYKAIQSNV